MRKLALILTIATVQAGEPLELMPFLTAYCIDCHGEKKQKGKLTLHDLSTDLSDTGNLETWRLVEEQVRFLDMPPEDEKQPNANERTAALKWLKSFLRTTQEASAVNEPKLLLPKFGNHIDHDTLFNQPAGPVVPGPPRLWRMRPELYSSTAQTISDGARQLSKPFSTHGGSGIQDYAALYFIDEPATDLLLRNAANIVHAQASKGRFGAIHQTLKPDNLPDHDLRSAAITHEFKLALKRDPTPEEIDRFLALWEKNLETSGHPIGSHATLMAVLMLPEALFRNELGNGSLDEHGRLRLSQREVARAINFALRDRLDDTLFKAAAKGKRSATPLPLDSRPIGSGPRSNPSPCPPANDQAS